MRKVKSWERSGKLGARYSLSERPRQFRPQNYLTEGIYDIRLRRSKNSAILRNQYSKRSVIKTFYGALFLVIGLLI